MLAKTGGKDLCMLTNDDGNSCLCIAALGGHVDVAEVQLSVCRQIDMKNALCSQIGHKE